MDSEENARLHYSIQIPATNNNNNGEEEESIIPWKEFHIDSYTGELYIPAMDAETVRDFNFTVVVVDSGIPELRNQTSVRIFVQVCFFIKRLRYCRSSFKK